MNDEDIYKIIKWTAGLLLLAFLVECSGITYAEECTPSCWKQVTWENTDSVGTPRLVQDMNIEPGDYKGIESERIWQARMPEKFKNRMVHEYGRIKLQAPYAAEDATIVPVSIKSAIMQGVDKHDIKTISIFVDKNPELLVGEFHFTTLSGKAEIATRIRVNENSFIRVIAETSNGKLYEQKSYIRARGACSAPPPASISESIDQKGKMKIKIYPGGEYNKPNLVGIQIKHPQITGLQPLRFGGGGIPPAYYINSFKVTFNEELIMSAKTGFSISMDPAFRFYFVPSGAGVLKIEATDTKGLIYIHEEKFSL
jgi:sulfur-oxidizing protein SoxY